MTLFENVESINILMHNKTRSMTKMLPQNEVAWFTFAFEKETISVDERLISIGSFYGLIFLIGCKFQD